MHHLTSATEHINDPFTISQSQACLEAQCSMVNFQGFRVIVTSTSPSTVPLSRMSVSLDSEIFQDYCYILVVMKHPEFSTFYTFSGRGKGVSSSGPRERGAQNVVFVTYYVLDNFVLAPAKAVRGPVCSNCGNSRQLQLIINE